MAANRGGPAPANAKLLNPTLIATALNMKPETVCKSLCVLPSIVSHIPKYCRWRRKCVEDEQTHWSRALPHFRRGRPPILSLQARAVGRKPHLLWTQTMKQSPLVHPLTSSLLCTEMASEIYLKCKMYKCLPLLLKLWALLAIRAHCKLQDTVFFYSKPGHGNTQQWC